MPRNPNLVPTVITDVNGKTTTVHRSQTKVYPSAVMPIPMPNLHNRNSLVNDTANLARDMCAEVRSSLNFDPRNVGKALGYLSDEAISDLYDYLSSRKQTDSVVQPIMAVTRGIDEKRLQSFFVGSKIVGESTELSFYEVTNIACGAAETVGAEPGFKDASDEMLDKAGAVMKVVEQIYLEMPSDAADPCIHEDIRNEGAETVIIVLPELRDIVLNNADRADEIVRFIKERDMADPEVLQRYLDDRTALAEGML